MPYNPKFSPSQSLKVFGAVQRVIMLLLFSMGSFLWMFTQSPNGMMLTVGAILHIVAHAVNGDRCIKHPFTTPSVRLIGSVVAVFYLTPSFGLLHTVAGNLAVGGWAIAMLAGMFVVGCSLNDLYNGIKRGRWS